MRKIFILFVILLAVNSICFSQSHWNLDIGAGTSVSIFKSTPYYGLIDSHGKKGNITVSTSFGGLVSAGVSCNFRNNYFFLSFNYRFYYITYRTEYKETKITHVGNDDYVYQEFSIDKHESNFIKNYLIPFQYGYSFITKNEVIFIPYAGWINEFHNSYREGLYLSAYSGYVNTGFKLRYKIFNADFSYAYCLTNFSDLHPDMKPHVVNIVVGVTLPLKATHQKE